MVEIFEKHQTSKQFNDIYTRHVISARRMTDVIQLGNGTPYFFFQPMKFEHLAVCEKIAPFLSCSCVQARNFPTLFITSEQVGHVFLVSAFYIAFFPLKTLARVKKQLGLIQKEQ